MQEMTSDPTETAFIRSISGNERIEDLLNRAEIPRDKAVLLLVALSEAGVITPGETPRVERVLEALRLAVRGHDLRAGGPTDADVSTEELIGDLEDDPAVLSVEPAPHAPISDDGDGDLPSGPMTGAATPLGSGPLSMVAQTVRTQDYFWALGVERSATAEAIDRAYEALARTFHADTYRQSPDEDRRLAQEIFDRLTEAHRVLSDPTQRRAYTEGIDLVGSDTAADSFPARASDAGTATPTKGAGGTTAGNAAANALYETGMEHLKARRHHEAVEAFRQAARLVPSEASFRAALGWSLFREAPADARAGRAALAELRRAIQIDGKNLRALHYLANYFAETGQPDLAVEELQRILQIDPDSTEAADQLRRLQDDRA
jgi:tetratricopeptide (TPR) repeat protein